METLSELLKGIRGERSFREMERRTGLSHVYLIQLENGIDPRSSKVRQPSLDTLKILSDKLHIDFATILASVGFPQMLEIQNDNKRLRGINEELKVSALKIVSDFEKHIESSNEDLAVMEKMLQLLKRKDSEIERLRNALEFYAKPFTYKQITVEEPPDIRSDGGQIAQQALKGDS